MPKKRMFDDGNNVDFDIQVDNEYAKNYDNWRKKEELNKLKTKYGEDALSYLEEEHTSSSSEDDEDGVEFTEKVEKEFFKTLSYLKNKDPRIYDQNVQFFENQEESSKSPQKKKKEKPMFLKDYERKLILEKGGKFDGDSDDEREFENQPLSLAEEELQRQENLKKLVQEDDENEEDNENIAGLFKARQKTEEEQQQEADDYKKWLAGQSEEIKDKEAETDLQPLKSYWNDPNLDEGEKFLRDYILKEKFLSKEDEEYIPTYEEVVHDSDKDLSEDEKVIDQQEEFEHKYNFRFEEPDQDFIKRYPRTMETSLRKTDDRRIVKRAETKERKQKEKEQKMQELKQLQEFKRKEIEDKLEKLREITGNANLGFNDEDIDADFDPEAHDKKMQALFNDEFYQEPEGDLKPKFPELDEYLELEDWDHWQGNDEKAENQHDSNPHCEDDDFNMDCDYDPKATLKDELIESSKGKKKRKRKSLFAKAVSQPKPVFDPNDKTYEEYLDQYYQLDCEDIVGDIPCRFKYRKVAPNSFGLSIEEILTANDRELNRWCSLKKAVQHRPDDVEKYEQIAYEKKAQNFILKKKILPSLFESQKGETVNDLKPSESSDNSKQNLKKKKELPATITSASQIKESEDLKIVKINEVPKSETSEKKKRKKKKKKTGKEPLQSNEQPKNTKNKKRPHSNELKNDETPNKKFKNRNVLKDKGLSDARLSAYGINPKKYKNKLKYGNKKE